MNASDRLREIERMRDKARVDEIYRMLNAEARGEKKSDEKWQGIVAELQAENERLRAQLENK